MSPRNILRDTVNRCIAEGTPVFINRPTIESEPFNFPCSERTSPPLYAVLPPVSASSARRDMHLEGLTA